MGRLDAAGLRYVSREEMRVLHAVEVCMRNHELVSGQLAAAVAQLRAGGSHKLLRQLQQRRLLAYERGRRYDGYRLTRQGYDYLALQALVRGSEIEALGAQIGTGKESDVYAAYDTAGETVALKFHRLGRNSFRRLKLLRDYHAHRRHISWLYLSSLSAAREHAFMRALHERGVPVPRPLGRSRHALLMSLVAGVPLCQWAVDWVPPAASVAALHSQCMGLMVWLVELGVVHCDFNEFNLMVVDGTGRGDESSSNSDDGVDDSSSDDEASSDGDGSSDGHDVSDGDGDEEVPRLVLIDLPQMVSTTHPNAKYLFDRDVQCLSRFFARRFNFHSDDVPDFDEIRRLDDVYAEVRSGEQEKTDESGESDEEYLFVSAKEDGVNNRASDEHDLIETLRNIDLTSACDREYERTDDRAGSQDIARETRCDVSGGVDPVVSAVDASVANVSSGSGPTGAVCGDHKNVVSGSGVTGEVCGDRENVLSGSGVTGEVCGDRENVVSGSGVTVAVCGDRETAAAARSVASRTCSVAESTLDAGVLERRLRQQMQRQRRRQLGRLRTKGDASAVTRGRRNNAATVQQSLSAVWCDGL